MRRIRVRFNESAEHRGGFDYALIVEIVEANDLPRKIFVYHQMPAGIDGNTFSEFDHIATPVDIQEIPEDAASELVPWYRTDKCTIWCRSLSDVNMAKKMFTEDIAAFHRNYIELSSEENFSKQTTLDFSEDGVKEVSG